MKKAGKMLFMSRSQKRSHRLVKWLADAIMTEMEKPDEEINLEFVESCENLLNTLMGEKKLSDKEINDRVNEIMERSGEIYTVPVRRKTKPALIALIAAVVLLLSCVTVCATTPISQYMLKALDLGLNQSVEENEITYSYNGANTIYRTLEELLESENIDICYPERFAYDSEITQIFKSESDNQTIFTFNDSRISFAIFHDTQQDLSKKDYLELLIYKNYNFYIYDLGHKFSAYTTINNDFYILSCDIKNDLIDMIYSFNFKGIE